MLAYGITGVHFKLEKDVPYYLRNRLVFVWVCGCVMHTGAGPAIIETLDCVSLSYINKQWVDSSG